MSEKVEIIVKRIKQISFRVDESAKLNNEFDKTDAGVELDFISGFNVEKDYVAFTLRVRYILPNINNQIFIETEVVNSFGIKDLKRFIRIEGEDPLLPMEVLTTIVGLSISHTRALLSASLSGTVYNNTVLPIFDPFIVTQHFFKDIIQIS